MHLHVEKAEQTAADEKLRGELSTRMGSVGTTPLTNSRTEENMAQHGWLAAVPAPMSRKPNQIQIFFFKEGNIVIHFLIATNWEWNYFTSLSCRQRLQVGESTVVHLWR